MQSFVDSGDPATFAPTIFRDRPMDRGHPPHVLLAVAVTDDTVPPSAGKALARALTAPHLEPIVEAVDGLEQAPTPASGNSASGSLTTGFFQFDRITRGDHVEAASHSRMPISPEGLLQIRRFFTPVKTGGLPEIVDPYELLETPRLASDD